MMADDNVIHLGDAKAAIADLAALDPMAYGMRRKAEAKRLGVSVTILDKEVLKRRRAPASDTKNLILNDRGAVVPILANAVEILRAPDSPWDLKYEEFSHRAFLKDKPLDDATLLQIAEWIQRQGCHAGRAVTDDAIITVAHAKRFHVVKDWLNGLEWDGAERIDMMMIDHAEADDTAAVRAFTSKTLIQAVARIFQPGCQADSTLVLEGPQGGGKSSLFRNLFGDEWFTDHLPNLDSKDAQIQLLGIWCVELSELAALSGKENAKTKQFLTSRDDRFRLPFDRIAKNHPRSSVFVGSVNPGAGGYLKDETGARRFWPVKVGHVDTGMIERCRDQFWAEAVHRYRQGEVWHIGNGDIADEARAAQADRYVSDPWHDTIASYVLGRQDVTLKEIFTEALEITDKGRWTQHDQNRIARCLSHLGWTRKQRRLASTLDEYGGKREWYYAAPVTSMPFDFEP